MIIGIDIDDTITDTYEVMMNYGQEFVTKELKKEPIIDENKKCMTHFYLKALLGWNDKEEEEFFIKYYEKIVKNVKPKTLALDYLNKLKEEGHKIILITARWETDNFDVKKETEKWIKENNIPCDKLIINAENKLIAAKEENLDVFIDDSFKNCKMVSSAEITTYMMDTRVNRGVEDEKVTRVYSWPHFYYLLNK